MGRGGAERTSLSIGERAAALRSCDRLRHFPYARCGPDPMGAASQRRSVGAATQRGNQMFKTILVGHDGSPQAAAAVDLARALSADDAAVELAMVTPTTLVPTLAGAWDYAVEEDARRSLSAAADRATLTAPTVGHLLRSSSPARALTERAEEIGADLVVLGSTHRGAAGRIILGTTAQRLLHGAPCTVAIAPKEKLTDRIRHIGVAYDG